MSLRYAVLGAGLQGSAVAYDLAVNANAVEVLLLDCDGELLGRTKRRLEKLAGRNCFDHKILDAEDVESLRRAVRGFDSAVSALPYSFNLAAARAAVAEKVHFCDLGGNTAVVLAELGLHEEAKRAGISLLPDCGLAPGLSNVLAARAIDQFDRAESVRVRCGGIPKNPRPPFNYKMVFNLNGLINEYSGDALVLRDGKIENVEALTQEEHLDVPGLGKLEAAVTSGGTSTAPYSFEGRVSDFDYKTLRHPGHFAMMRAYKALGLFSEQPREAGGLKFVPRKVLIDLLSPLIDFPDDEDLIVLTLEGRGYKSGRKGHYKLLLLDQADSCGFSAMERTTGFPTAAIAAMQARGEISPGAVPIEKSVPHERLLEEVRKRSLNCVETITWE